MRHGGGGGNGVEKEGGMRRSREVPQRMGSSSNRGDDCRLAQVWPRIDVRIFSITCVLS